MIPIERPLSVCFVTPEYPMTATAHEGIGGAATHSYTLAHAIAGLGHRVVVVTYSSTARSFTDGAVRVEVLAVRSRRLWKLGRLLPVSWIRRSWGMARALRRLNREHRFDIVSFPDCEGVGFFYAFWPKGHFVIQLFGPATLVERWDKRRVPRVRGWVQGVFERHPVRKASLVICATERFAGIIAREWSLHLRRLRVIRNPLNVDLFQPANGRGEPRGKTVLFVGHLQYLKGLLALAASVPIVVRDHPDVHFVLLGNDTRSGPDGTSMRGLVSDFLHERGVLSHVTFATPVPQTELVSRYQGCSVFVLPSLRDVFPNAVLEAMACGRPCITTHATGVAEIIEDGRSGFLVPPDDPAELGRAISRVLAMTARDRDEIGRRARATVERCCTGLAIAHATVEAYKELLALDRRT